MFMFLTNLSQVVCLLFVPIYAGMRLSLERNDANIDLFFVTTITPGAIDPRKVSDGHGFDGAIDMPACRS